MDCTPHWTSVVTAIAAPAIAIIAAWIAYRQSQIARNKLKLDLFEKRMAVYQVVRDTLGIAVSHGKLTHEEEINFVVGTRPAKWLFGPEVFRYLDETLWHKIVDFGLHNTMMEDLHSAERTKHVHARAEIMKWLMKQFKDFDQLCVKYLTIEH